MPKLIENLRERLILCAREMLLADGYDRLTIRDAAKRCEVAVGTVYNYFPSKDVLVASIMLEDWMQTLAHMQKEAEVAPCAMDGLRATFADIADFAATYHSAWAQYAARMNATPILRSRHGLIIKQLSEIIQPLCEHFGCLFHPALPVFLAETLLSASVDSDARFDDLAPILEKLLK